MSGKFNLKELAEVDAPDRAFLSVYLEGPGSLKELDKRLDRIRITLKKGTPEEKDELEYFEANVKMIKSYLKRNPFDSGALCLFAGWVVDFFRAIPLAKKIHSLIRIDSSPYIRPLAELEDEYENAAVIVADNKKTRIYMVTLSGTDSDDMIKGNVKNHVKKGGWSQQRYERRRDKQLMIYAREITDALVRLDKEENFRRIVMVGSKETLREVINNLPKYLEAKVSQKAVDLNKSSDDLDNDIMEMLNSRERESEQDLWEKIRVNFLKGGLGVLGLDEVYDAAKAGRIETMLVNRGFTPEGRRCRECGHLSIDAPATCPSCGSDTLFTVDVVNEIVEILKITSSEVDFTDTIEALEESGDIAAFLRY